MVASSMLRRILVLAAAAALAAAAGVLVAQSSSQTSVPVCVKNNGQVRVLVGNASCDASEVRADWVVGGEVTDISLGRGLVGTRQGGTMQLALDPTVLDACTGCRGSRIFAGFNDGPVALPTGFPQEIARLDLPAGAFSILAKMTIVNTLDEGFDDRVLCSLVADADFDRADVVLSEDVRTVIQHPHNDATTLTLQVVHQFTAAGSVTVSCYEQDSEPDLSFRDLKIIAVEGSSLSNVFVGQ